MKRSMRYAGVSCTHYRYHEHKVEECWTLYLEKKPIRYRSGPVKEASSKAYSAMVMNSMAHEWLLDLAASFHMIKERSNDIEPLQEGEKIIMATGQQLQSANIRIMTIRQMALKEVRLMPDLDRNLMSISALDKDG
jgi:hypothetical protein